MMKSDAPGVHPGLRAPALACLLLLAATLLAAPAHARKECRNAPPAGDPAPTEAVQDRWPHDADHDWHHESGSYDWVHQSARYVPDDGSWVQWSGPSGSFHDSTKSRLSLVSEPALGSWDRRRFRTNVILDGPGDVDLVGAQIGIGSVRLDVTKQIDRCVMTTRPQPALGESPALDRDLDVLRTIAAEHDNHLAVGALVAQPGTIAVGDQIARV